MRIDFRSQYTEEIDSFNIVHVTHFIHCYLKKLDFPDDDFVTCIVA